MIPFHGELRRHELRQASTLALGLSLKALIRASDFSASERRDAAKLARKISACAVTQRFWVKADDQGVSRFHFMNKRACACRICPACEYRRSMKAAAALIGTISFLLKICPSVRLIFLTLSTKNREFTDTGLRGMFTDHVNALPRLFSGNERVRSAILGHWTQVEVAVREHGGKPFAGVHSHSLVAVDGARYWTDPAAYLTQPAWRDAWAEAARLSYRPIVDVRIPRDKSGDGGAAAMRSVVFEASKYVCKPFFKHSGKTISVDGRVALTIVRVLHRQRMVRADRIWIAATKRRRAALKIETFENPGE